MSEKDLFGLGLAVAGGFLLGKTLKSEDSEEIKYLKKERRRLMSERDDVNRLYDEEEEYEEDTEDDVDVQQRSAMERLARQNRSTKHDCPLCINNPRPIPLDYESIHDLVNRLTEKLKYTVNILQGEQFGEKKFRNLPKSFTLLAQDFIDIKRIGYSDLQKISVYIGSDKTKSYSQSKFIPKIFPEAGYNSTDKAVVLYIDPDVTINQLDNRIKHNNLQPELYKQLLHELTHATEIKKQATRKILEEKGYDEYLNDPFEIRASLQVMISQLDQADEKMFRMIFLNLPFDYVVRHFSNEYLRLSPHLTEENQHKLLSSAYQFFKEKGFNVVRQNPYKNVIEGDSAITINDVDEDDLMDEEIMEYLTSK